MHGKKCSHKMNFIYNPIHCLLENKGCNTKPCKKDHLELNESRLQLHEMTFLRLNQPLFLQWCMQVILSFSELNSKFIPSSMQLRSFVGLFKLTWLYTWHNTYEIKRVSARACVIQSTHVLCCKRRTRSRTAVLMIAREKYSVKTECTNHYNNIKLPSSNAMTSAINLASVPTAL